ncbi:MAG: dTMP kinase [Nitrospinales bacterium]|nr:dTMP kinase [Nitrospinales bacterium]
MNRGLLIVFEGIDGSGKSTQCRMLADLLNKKGIANISLAEPTRGKWGMKIRQLLAKGRNGISANEELEWFMNDRREDVKQNIEPALKAGKVVLMDRYYFSTAAYQGALGFDPEKIRVDNERFAPIPDRVLIFHNSPEKSLERIESSREEKSAFEKRDYLIEVQTIFKSFTGPNIRYVSSDSSLEKVYEQVLCEVQDLFEVKL